MNGYKHVETINPDIYTVYIYIYVYIYICIYIYIYPYPIGSMYAIYGNMNPINIPHSC